MRRGPKKLETGPPAAVVESVVNMVTPENMQEEVAVAAGKIVLSDDPRKEQLSQIARDYHDATVRIIRMWLQEESHKARMGNGSGMSVEVSQ
jgi:hypothetical protein